MNDITTPARVAGSGQMQGDLWSVRARDYAEIQEEHLRPLYESVSQRPELAKARSSLDVGCGPGLAAQVFAQKIANVSGIDASAAFIEIARERLPGRNFRVGEMEALPFADRSFDVVTGFNAFQYAAAQVNALREARRVAQSDGVIVIATWGLPEVCGRFGRPPQSPWCIDAATTAGSTRSLRPVRRNQIEGASIRGWPDADRRGRRRMSMDLPQPGYCVARNAVGRTRRTGHPKLRNGTRA